MRAHFLHPRTPPEWGLSVAAMPRATEENVLKAARHLRQSHYRVASVQAVHALNPDPLAVPAEQAGSMQWLSLLWDHNAHGLLLANQEPTMELVTLIAGLFGPAKVNPYYEERSRSRASR